MQFVILSLLCISYNQEATISGCMCSTEVANISSWHVLISTITIARFIFQIRDIVERFYEGISLISPNLDRNDGQMGGSSE